MFRMSATLKAGDWVQIKSKEEILRTLDSEGQIEGMPFMPEMFQFCGRRFRVARRAHKTCDPTYKSRRVERAVHLETRCDGQAHGGCQAGCTFFWKEAWLRTVDGKEIDRSSAHNSGSSESLVWDRTQHPKSSPADRVYVCQTTQVQHLPPIAWWDVRQYVEDYRSGNVTLKSLIRGGAYSAYYHLAQAGIGLGPIMRWAYNLVRPLGPNIVWPRTSGSIPSGEKTPAVDLNLQPGELVKVKSQSEILRTVTTANLNRGMYWDAELVPYCDQTLRVLDRVNRVLDEKTGKMVEMKTPSIILDSAVCGARYSDCRMFCPRATYAYWREIWLERVSSNKDKHDPVPAVAASISSSQRQ